MKQYLIEITAEVPVPRRFQYRENGTNIAVAVSRAIRSLRKDLPRKRILALTVRATPIGELNTLDRMTGVNPDTGRAY